MTRRPPTSVSDWPHCPACANLLIGDCVERCPLCGHDFTAQEVVSTDSTPYASAPRSYMRMVGWVLLAGSQRLGYLARMRASRASAWFMAQNLVLLGLAGVLLAMPQHGWVQQSSFCPAVQPQGRGWRHAQAEVPAPAETGRPVLQRLWWNPGLWAVAMGLSFFAVMLLGGLALILVRAGAEVHLRRAYRGEDRFGAALHYHTAHIPLLLLAGLCYGSSVLVPVAEIRRWPVRWPLEVHTAAAVLLGAAALFLMWFWWLRLAHTSPVDTRARLTWYFAVWAPWPPALLVGGWLWAQKWVLPLLAKELDMHF